MLLNKRYQALMRVLKQHAPIIPPLRQVAEQTGFASGSSVKYALNRLVRLGKIRIVTNPRHHTEVYINPE